MMHYYSLTQSSPHAPKIVVCDREHDPSAGEDCGCGADSDYHGPFDLPSVEQARQDLEALRLAEGSNGMFRRNVARLVLAAAAHHD